MVAIIDVLGLLEVKEGDPVLQVADLVADRNLIGGTENAVLQGFVEDGDFFEHF
jgi:aminoglycoside N3'-acetyltransferase